MRSPARLFGPVDLTNPAVFYYVLLASSYCSRSTAAASSTRASSLSSGPPGPTSRARGIGFSPYRYKLTAFAIAGSMGGLAGACLPTIPSI